MTGDGERRLRMGIFAEGKPQKLTGRSKRIRLAALLLAFLCARFAEILASSNNPAISPAFAAGKGKANGNGNGNGNGNDNGNGNGNGNGAGNGSGNGNAGGNGKRFGAIPTETEMEMGALIVIPTTLQTETALGSTWATGSASVSVLEMETRSASA